LSLRLTKVDSLTISDHSYLDNDDECFYLGEYTARAGFSFSATNNLIQNLKKPLDRKERPEWRYKNLAIQEAGIALRGAIGEGMIRSATWVPMPPSKAKGHPMYDDRILRVLQKMGSGLQFDLREMIQQKGNLSAAHEANEPRSVEKLIQAYSIDDNTCGPPPTFIIVVDDVLTTGAHFKAAKQLLLSRFLDACVQGVFIARRSPEASII